MGTFKANNIYLHFQTKQSILTSLYNECICFQFKNWKHIHNFIQSLNFHNITFEVFSIISQYWGI